MCQSCATALHLACDRVLVDKVRLLLEWGCDPAKCNEPGQIAAEAIGKSFALIRSIGL